MTALLDEYGIHVFLIALCVFLIHPHYLSLLQTQFLKNKKPY